MSSADSSTVPEAPAASDYSRARAAGRSSMVPWGSNERIGVSSGSMAYGICEL